MARPLRIITNNAIYHIYQRGNNKEFIFNNPKHKDFFVSLLKQYSQRFDYQLLRYVVMSNHYHLLIHINNDTIDKIMFNINNTLAKYLSRELQHTGHVYEDRYKSKIIQDDVYLIWVLRYIHRNPIRANICNNLEHYKWVSHTFYKSGIKDFINIDFILDIINPNRKQAIKRYMNIMELDENKESKEKDFCMLKQNFFSASSTDISSLSNDLPTNNLTSISLENILNSLNFAYELKQSIRNAIRKNSLTKYKIDFITTALSYKYSLVEISKFINTTPSALGKFISYHNIAH